MVDMQVKGLDQVLKKLNKLPERVQKNVVVGAVRASTKPLVKAAKANAPEDTGNLKESIAVTRGRPKKKTLVWFSVSPTVKKKTKRFKTKDGGSWSITGLVADGWYGHMVEFGTVKQPAQPYLRPAYEQEGDKTIKTAQEYMSKRVEKEIAKL